MKLTTQREGIFSVAPSAGKGKGESGRRPEPTGSVPGPFDCEKPRQQFSLEYDASENNMGLAKYIRNS
jgi:hypothetical protein